MLEISNSERERKIQDKYLEIPKRGKKPEACGMI